MDEKVAVEALRQVKRILDEHGIEYWLDCGTLLGAIREKRFIPWDGDIDLGVWQEEFDKIVSLSPKFYEKGFEIYFSDQKNSISLFKRNCKISITFYVLRGNKMVHIGPSHANRKIGQLIDYLLWILKIGRAELKKSSVPLFITYLLIKIARFIPGQLRKKLIYILQILYKNIGSIPLISEIPEHYFTNLSTLKFYGMEFKIPSNTEDYLEFRYGKKWNIPYKSYKYWRDDGAIVRKGKRRY